jgi:hypothetical protein
VQPRLLERADRQAGQARLVEIDRLPALLDEEPEPAKDLERVASG